MTWTEIAPLLLTVIAAIIAAIPGTLALLKGRSKEKADAASTITGAASKLLEEYRLKADEIEEEYRAKIEEYLIKIDEIEAAMADQAEQIRCQDRRIAKQDGELAFQQIELKKQEARIKDLEVERDEIMEGVKALCTQIRKLGHEPVWEPNL
jgi:chromosome segregation ATPase